MLLDKIKKVLEEREGNYDDPLPNFTRIANYWNDYLEDRINKKLTPIDIANLMVLMKMAREQYSHSEDNMLDMIGYILCNERIYDIIGDLKEENRKKKKQ